MSSLSIDILTPAESSQFLLFLWRANELNTLTENDGDGVNSMEMEHFAKLLILSRELRKGTHHSKYENIFSEVTYQTSDVHRDDVYKFSLYNVGRNYPYPATLPPTSQGSVFVVYLNLVLSAGAPATSSTMGIGVSPYKSESLVCCISELATGTTYG